MWHVISKHSVHGIFLRAQKMIISTLTALASDYWIDTKTAENNFICNNVIILSLLLSTAIQLHISSNLCNMIPGILMPSTCKSCFKVSELRAKVEAFVSDYLREATRWERRKNQIARSTARLGLPGSAGLLIAIQQKGVRTRKSATRYNRFMNSVFRYVAL